MGVLALTSVPTAVCADAFVDGLAAHQAGDLAKAHERYRAATTESPGNAEAWYHRGLTATALEVPAEAAQSYQEAIAREPSSPFMVQFRCNLGWALIDAGEIPAGLAELKAVVEARPADRWAVTNYAHALYLHAEDFNTAEEWYGRLTAEFPTAQGERDLAGRWLREAKQRATILKIGTGYELFRGEVIAGTLEGRDYGSGVPKHSIRIRTTDGGEKVLRKSDITHVTTEPKYRGMGRSVRRGAGERVRTLFSAISAPENLRQGRALKKGGRTADAEAQFRMALRKDPRANAARLALAESVHQRKAYAEAAELFEACLAQDASLARARYYLVSTYANHLGQLPTALKHGIAYAQLPNAPQADAIEAATVQIVGQLIQRHDGGAESEWMAASGLQPDSVQHRRILGMGYLHAKRPGPALRHLGAAVELWQGRGTNPALAPLEQCLAQLEGRTPRPPAAQYYRGYLHFARGQLEQAKAALAREKTDGRAQTLLALVYAYQGETAAAKDRLAAVDRNALPPPTRTMYDAAQGVVDAPGRYRREQAANAAEAPQAGSVQALAILGEGGAGTLLPVSATVIAGGAGQFEVNGNAGFDAFTVPSLKTPVDWIEIGVDATYPAEWDTTITFDRFDEYRAQGGESAASAVALSLCSAVTEQAVLPGVTVLGAVKLDGTVEPVTHVTTKVLRPLTTDTETVILPAPDLADLGTLSTNLCSRVKFVGVDSMKGVRFHAIGPNDPKTASAFTESEERFRTGATYFRLGAYALARPLLKAAAEQTPENYSARRLLKAIGDADVGPILDGAGRG